ncbi:MAG: hypothetical protein AB7T07_06990 [Steroidobacteraceae bacterium]
MQNPTHSSGRPSGSQPEIIAVVLPDGTPDSPAALCDHVATGTMLLVRHADGRMALEPVRREAAWERRATSTGSFGRRKPILDPVSREVMGYEMEMSELPIAS